MSAVEQAVELVAGAVREHEGCWAAGVPDSDDQTVRFRPCGQRGPIVRNERGSIDWPAIYDRHIGGEIVKALGLVEEFAYRGHYGALRAFGVRLVTPLREVTP